MACGYEIGPALFGPMMGYILSIYGWRASMLAMGLISTMCYLCCLVFQPPTHSSYEEIVSQVGEEKVPEVEETEKYKEVTPGDNMRVLSPQMKNTLLTGTLDKASTNYKKQTHLWKTPLFLALCLSQVFFNMFYQAVYVYTPLKANTLDIPSDKSAWLLPMLGISAIILRLALAKVLENHPRTLIYSAVLCQCCAGLVSLITPVMTSFSALAVYSIVSGGCLGTDYIIYILTLKALNFFRKTVETKGFFSIWNHHKCLR